MSKFCKILFLISLISCKNSGNNNSASNAMILTEELKEIIVSELDCFKYDYDNLEEAIQNRKCVKQLYLRNNNYKYIPIEVFEFKNLEELDIGSNLIKTIPGEISRLRNLKELRLSYNLIDSISNNIGNLVNLEVLWLLDNNIEVIPESICSLSNLTELNLTQNKLTDIPNCIVQMDALKSIYIEAEDGYKINNKRVMELRNINPNCVIYN